MVRLRFSGQCLLLVTLFTRCFAQNDMNDMLLPDRELSGPGVLARLTPGGTSYVSAVVARALAHEIPLSRIPGQINSTRLKSLPTVTLSDLRLNVFQLPATFNVAPVSPNIVAVSLRNTILSLGAYGTGRIDQVPVDSRMDIKTWQLALQVSIKINRNNRGNPRLTVDTCRVPERIPVTVAVVKALTPETGAKLANSIAEEGHLLFEQMICSRLVHIMENRINQRFTLLASKITLGETNNFDLVRNILSSARAAVPLQRPRPVPSPRTVLRNPARQLVHRRQSVEGGIQRRPVQLHLGASDQQRMFRRHADAEKIHAAEPLRIKRQAEQGDFHAFLSSFNLSRADSLLLDYGMVSIPIISPRGIEIAQVGEITANGGHTPFGPRPAFLPPTPSTSAMLQIVVSDFVPNTLMYHGHRIGLFNTRVDPNTPQFGPVMRTTCDLSTGSLFCVGDLFPTLREMVPDRGIAFLFSTLKAPAVLVHPEAQGGIKFQLLGLIEILSLEAGGAERRVGSMEIHIDATMKMKLSSKIVRGKVNLENIKLITRTPNILAQDELDDAGFLSREILQRMVNDILKQGVPIPVHPLFKLQKPKLTLLERSMLLETNFELKDKLIHQLTTQHLVA